MKKVLLLILFFILILSFFVVAEEFALEKFKVIGDARVFEGEQKFKVLFNEKVEVIWKEKNAEKTVKIEDVRGTVYGNGIISAKAIKDTKLFNTIIKQGTIFTYDLSSDALTIKDEGDINYKNSEWKVGKDSFLTIYKDKIIAKGKFFYKDLSFEVPDNKLISIGPIPNKDDFLAINYQDQYNFEIVCKGECKSDIGATSFNAKSLNVCQKETYTPKYKCLSSGLEAPYVSFKRLGGEDTEVVDALTISHGAVDINKGGLEVFASGVSASIFVDPKSFKKRIPTTTNLYIKNKETITAISPIGDVYTENPENINNWNLISDRTTTTDKVVDLGNYILPLNFLKNLKLLQTWDGPIPKEGDLNYKEYQNMLDYNSGIWKKLAAEGAFEVGKEGAIIAVGGVIAKPVSAVFSQIAISSLRKAGFIAETKLSKELVERANEKILPYLEKSETLRYLYLMARSVPESAAKSISKSSEETVRLVKINHFWAGQPPIEEVTAAIGKSEGEILLNPVAYNYIDNVLRPSAPISKAQYIIGYPTSFEEMLKRRLGENWENIIANGLKERGANVEAAQTIASRLASQRPFMINRQSSSIFGQIEDMRSAFHERGHHAYKSQGGKILFETELLVNIAKRDPKILEPLERMGYSKSELIEEFLVDNVALKRFGAENEATNILFNPGASEFFKGVVSKVFEGTFKPIPAVIAAGGTIKNLKDLYGRIEKAEIKNKDVP